MITWTVLVIFSLCCFVLGDKSVACGDSPSGYPLHGHLISQQIEETLILLEVVC